MLECTAYEKEEASNKKKFLWELSSNNFVIYIKVYFVRKF